LKKAASVMAIDKAIQRLSAIGGKLRVRSALNPMLWLCFVISMPGTLLLAVVDSFPIWAVIAILLPIVVACTGYIILLLKDPDKLQSEEYQINKQLLELALEKGASAPELLIAEKLLPNPDAQPETKRTEDPS
jgi:hypothetical protein